MTRSVRNALPVVVLALLLAGCASPAVETTVPVEVAPAPEATSPDPLTQAELQFVDEVAGIAPALAEAPERLARRAGNSCTDIGTVDAGQPWPSNVVDNAITRFSGGSYTVSTEEAEAILDAARATVCAD